MGIKSSMNTTSVLIEKYINSAYDTVKTVYDNISDINLVANSIDELEVINTYPEGTLTHYKVTLTETTNSITLTGVGNTDAIQVFINGVHQDDDYFSLVNGVLTFQDSFEAGTDISVYSSTTLFSSVDLSNVNTIANEIAQTPDGSFVNYVDNKVNTAISNLGINIPDNTDVLFKTHNTILIDGQTEVALPTNTEVSPSSILVFVNGVNQTISTTANTASCYVTTIDSVPTLVFNTGLNRGDLVTIYSTSTVFQNLSQHVVDFFESLNTLSTTFVVSYGKSSNYINSFGTIIDLTTIGYSTPSAITIHINGVNQPIGVGYVEYSVNDNTLTLPEAALDTDIISVTVMSGNVPTLVPAQRQVRSINITSSGSVPGEYIKGASNTLILLGWEYNPSMNELLVFVNGVLQRASIDYLESTSTSISLQDVLVDGDRVDVVRSY